MGPDHDHTVFIMNYDNVDVWPELDAKCGYRPGYPIPRLLSIKYMWYFAWQSISDENDVVGPAKFRNKT
jgi:hypothetical protein